MQEARKCKNELCNKKDVIVELKEEKVSTRTSFSDLQSKFGDLMTHEKLSIKYHYYFLRSPSFAKATSRMTNALIIIFTIFSICLTYTSYAEDSPFDVLNAEDRYKSEPAKEFDINEGEEETTATAPTQNHNVFDVMHNAPSIQETGSYYGIAKIVALNKITAKSKEFSVKIGSTAYFGNIAISVKKCWSNNDPYFPQNKILLSVVESRVDEDPQNIFTGWMISSNIQASAMEHPSYELIAIDCHNGK